MNGKRKYTIKILHLWLKYRHLPDNQILSELIARWTFCKNIGALILAK